MDPPLETFSGRGDFSLGDNMGSNSIPQKTLSDESINRGLVCAHMHFIARTQKILTFMSWTGECRQQKHTPSTHHPRRQNVTTLMVGLKKTVTYAKISPKSGEPQRYSWGTQKKNKKNKKNCFLVVQCLDNMQSAFQGCLYVLPYRVRSHRSNLQTYPVTLY